MRGRSVSHLPTDLPHLLVSLLISTTYHNLHLLPSWSDTDEREGNPREGPTVGSHDTTGDRAVALTLEPSSLEGRSCLLCLLRFPNRDSLDQTLVRPPGASLLLLSPHLGPWSVFGLPSLVLPRILLSQFSEDPAHPWYLLKFLIHPPLMFKSLTCLQQESSYVS